MALNANQFPSIYKALGIDLTKLGCVMLPLQTIAMPIVDLPTYKSNNEARFWINGWIAGTKAHATLLYGLLPNAHALEPHIREVLADWQRPESIDTFHVDYFDSPYPDEKYHCLIVHLDPRPLIEAHKRLNLLPHINTFPEFKPHMTLGYVPPMSAYDLHNVITKLSELLPEGILVAGDIDLGRN